MDLKYKKIPLLIVCVLTLKFFDTSFFKSFMKYYYG